MHAFVYLALILLMILFQSEFNQILGFLHINKRAANIYKNFYIVIIVFLVICLVGLFLI